MPTVVKLPLVECVYRCMRNRRWWTFWDLQRVILRNTGVYYGEPSISAAIRELRKEPFRIKYNFPMHGEVVDRRRKPNSKGYEYKLIGVSENER